MIDKRLRAIIDQIPNAHTLADIGCDHGLTCFYALKSGKVKKVIATDVSQMSLKKAQDLFSERGVLESADFRCGNGLKVLKDKEADVIVITGMGGQEIISILEDAKRQDATFVLSPQSDIPDVRVWLIENGYAILLDKTIESAGKFYVLLKAQKGHTEYSPIEIKYGRDNILDKSQDFVNWIDFELNRIERIIKTSDSENTRSKFLEYKKELINLKTNV